MTNVELFKGDITKLEVDAIVNAANKTLLGGGGVDGAIHKAAGKELLKECKTLNGCNTGEAKLTYAYNLPAKYIIHTVGPIWKGGRKNEAKLLADCYTNSLELAVIKKIKTIAFPNISTGIYGFPKDTASKIAFETIKKNLGKNRKIRKVVFCVFDEANFEIYKKLFKNQ